MRKLLLAALGVAAAFVAAVVILRRGRGGGPASAERVVSERPLDTLTRDELYEIAQELDIRGRSKMKKPDLLEAVRQAERSG